VSHVQVRWGNDDHTFIVWEFEKGWKWTDLYTARRIFDELMNSVTHTVHIIFNMNKTLLPIGDALYNFEAVGGQYPKHTGLLIVVNASSFGVKITQIVMRIFRIWGNMMFVETMKEAYEKISAHTS
jgi:hypothetical protein